MNKGMLIFRTNYFSRLRPWLKRTILCGIVFFGIFLYDGELMYPLGLVALVVIFSIPVDDLALYNQLLYLKRRSIIPFFTVIKSYDLSTLKDVSHAGSYSAENDLFALLSFGQLYQSTNSVKLVYEDGSTFEFKIGIYKGDLDKIVSEIIALKLALNVTKNQNARQRGL